jgi:hypothetical protein
MKRLIRHSVFETNSSSSHSITISETPNMLQTITPDESGRIVLGTGEYGWGYEHYNDAETKADYAALFARNGQTWGEDYRILTTDHNELMGVLEIVLKEQTGATEIVFEDDGYIDHQSLDNDELMDLFKNPSALRNWIFNPACELIIDNDNR